ncbi:MAG: 16S rRNA processing protein RimM [Clostridiales bacterium]|nr:16S rRNA processing protein RimM [Candidatus Crickella merdequi]
MALSDKNEMIEIGIITSSVGIKGEVRVTLYAGESDNLVKGARLTLKKGKLTKEGTVASIRYQGGRPVVKFEGTNDRNAADELRDYELFIAESDLAELSPGEFYIRDLIGFDVYDMNSDSIVGIVSDYIQNRAQALWEVTTPEDKSVLIPDVDAFVKNIDAEKRVIEVALIPGFLE